MPVGSEGFAYYKWCHQLLVGTREDKLGEGSCVICSLLDLSIYTYCKVIQYEQKK